MRSNYFVVCILLITLNVRVECASAAVHSHSVNNLERESDGSYRPRDFEHYTDSRHNTEFDHEAIIGSVKEAEEYDTLTPEESRQRLELLLVKMDLNGDKHIDKQELNTWILSSFQKLSAEEASERLAEADEDGDGVVAWVEYLQDGFGVEREEDVGPDDVGENGMMLQDEKAMWAAADIDGDGKLNNQEFEVFINPEEHEQMHQYLVNQTFREKDKNRDGVIDIHEYLGEKDAERDREWTISERDKFEHDLDLNKDGALDHSEVQQWIIPNNNEIADEEVEHLFEAADDNKDSLLSFQEILSHQDVFVGSEAADPEDLMGDHFDDEL